MEYLILALIAAGIWYYFKAKKPEHHDGSPKIELPIKITVSSSPDSSFSPDKVDSGAITETIDGFILNPKSPCPLTITDLTRAEAVALKGYLDEEVNWGRKIREIAYILAQSNGKCKEVDEYVEKYRPQYLASIERLKAESPEWNVAPEKDKEDLLSEFRQEALNVLPVKPSNPEVLDALFEDAPSDVTADDKLIEMFDQDTELYRFYVSQLWSAGQVRNVPADDYYRKRYEALVQKGLARRGQDIALEEILSGLRLKDINQAIQGLIEKPFGRKAKAIEFALTVPDIKDRLGKHVAFREMFQIRKPEGVDVQEIQRCYKHANAVATILRDTYVSGIRTLKTLNEAKGADFDYWEICAEGCCAHCAPFHGKKYKRKPSKIPPFHIGCGCEVEGGYD